MGTASRSRQIGNEVEGGLLTNVTYNGKSCSGKCTHLDRLERLGMYMS